MPKIPLTIFEIHDRHGNVLALDSFATVAQIEINADDGVGEASATGSYEDGKLTINFHNIKADSIKNITFEESQEDGGENFVHVKMTSDSDTPSYTFPIKNGSRGNGITEIETDEQTGDEAVNTVTFRTTDGTTDKTIHIKNGSRGNGIADIEEIRNYNDSGTNEIIIHYTDGRTKTVYINNGGTGRPGESAVFDPQTGNISEMQQTTGDSIVSPMSQDAITRELDPLKRSVFGVAGGITWTEGQCMHPSSPWKPYINSAMQTSNKIPIKEGDTITVVTKGQTFNFTVIAYLETENQETGWVKKASISVRDETLTHTLSWVADANGYVVVSGTKEGMQVSITPADAIAKQADLAVEKARVDELYGKINGRFEDWVWNSGLLHPASAGVQTNETHMYSDPVTLHRGDVVKVTCYYPHSEVAGNEGKSWNYAVIARYINETTNELITDTSGNFNQFIYREYKCEVEEEQIRVCVYIGNQIPVGEEKYSAYIERADALVRKDEIASLIEGGLPDYWKAYLNAKMPTIAATVPQFGDSFIFVTDTHYSENYGNSTAVIAEITKYYPFCKVIHGGDTCSTGWNVDIDTVPKTYEQMCIREQKAYDRLAREAGDYARFYAVRGNHDFDEFNGNINYKHPAEQSVRHLRKVTDEIGMMDGNATDRLYYYVDNMGTNVNIRYIILDTMDRGGNDRNVGIQSTQLNWLIGVLNNTPQGYKIVVIGHAPISTYFAGSKETYADWLEALRVILVAYNASASGTITTKGSAQVSVEYDFTNRIGGDIIMYLHGHTHVDNQLFHDGIPFVGVICDKKNHYGWSPFCENTDLASTTKQNGTVKEQAFEAVVINENKDIISFNRIGIGFDRHFHVGKIELSVGQTHSFTASKITAAQWVISDEDVASQDAKSTGSSTAIVTKNEYATISDNTVTAVAPGDVLVFAEDENHNKEFFHVKVVTA